MNAKDIVKKMTLEEKVSICVGENSWQTKAFPEYGIPSLFMCDGPSGLRKQERKSGTVEINDSIKATAYPAACTMATSFDEETEKEVGKCIAQEAKNQKAGLVLGPGINIKRNPLCGRNFEYFSEDPVVAGRMGAALINGIQSEGIGACLKHFACNNQEYDRFNSNGVIDERTLREIYLKGFEIAVKTSHPKSLMSSYPAINGVHSSNNKKLLHDVLRQEWGFDGMVVTDWGGMSDRVEAMVAGNDLCMPGGSKYMEKEVIEAVESGKLDEKYIDECASNIISLALSQSEVLKEDYDADYNAHHELAIKAATAGAVLLKNENNVLPLNKEDKVLVVGAMAKNMRYQGSGSSHINAYKVDQPIDNFDNYIFAQGCDDDGDSNETLLNEIKDKAKDVKTIVVFAGLPYRYESEGFDRDNLLMPKGHLDMIKTARETGKKVVVVLACGCVVDCNWEVNADAILYIGLAGEGVGKATSKLLYGEVNPSGKLSETWPMKYEDVPNHKFFATQTDALYKEGIYVGYRYFDTVNMPVRYPFGYGLSYSKFDYKDFHLEGKEIVGTITNDSEVAGKEIVEVYVGLNNSPIYNPSKQLKDFTKVSLLPHESKEVRFTLSDDYFMSYADGWKVIDGDYTIYVGSSSRDIKAKLDKHVSGEKVTENPNLKNTWYETLTGEVSDEDYEKLLGYKYVPKKLKKGEFTMENTINEMKDYSWAMRKLYKEDEKRIAKVYGGKVDYNNPDFKMMMNSSSGAPLRTMIIFGSLQISQAEGLLDMANGHYLRGIGKIIK